MSDARDEEREARERTSDLKEGAAPEPVGVYERPQRSGPSPMTIAIVVLVLLLVGALTVYMFLL